MLIFGSSMQQQNLTMALHGLLYTAVAIMNLLTIDTIIGKIKVVHSLLSTHLDFTISTLPQQVAELDMQAVGLLISETMCLLQKDSRF